MVDRQQALQIAKDYLKQLFGDSYDQIAVRDDKTLSREYGWVFFYNSRKFIDTRDPMDSLVGNSPFVVLKATGEVCLLGTAPPFEDRLAAFEQRRGLTKN